MKKIQRVFIILFAAFICINTWRAAYISYLDGDKSVATLMFIVGVLAMYVPITIIDLKKDKNEI
jgi:hypothetical protein